MHIQTAACIGSGLIGLGWTTLFSSHGLRVMLQDEQQEQLNTALPTVKANLELLEERGFLVRGSSRSALERITTTRELSLAVAQADYVQENTPDNYLVKQEVFKAIDAAAPAEAILASSSSGLLMTKIQRATKRPKRCILVHPFLPIHLMPLVEIVGGEQTSPKVIAATRAFMEDLGKTPVVLKKEVPGYIVNRLQAALLREAMDLVDRGVAEPDDIDTAFRKGMGLRDPIMGPFLRAYLAGNGLENFFQHFEESYRTRLEDMATWTVFPQSVLAKVLHTVKDSKILQGKSLEEFKTWRDRKLIDFLKLLSQDDPSVAESPATHRIKD